VASRRGIMLSLRAFFAKQSHLSETRLLRRKNLLAMTRTRQADGELNTKRLKDYKGDIYDI